MTISFLTPSARTEKIPPPLLRRPARVGVLYDERHTLSINQFKFLPADKKAGFLLLPVEQVYVKKYTLPDEARREAAHRLVEAAKSPTSPEIEFNRAMLRNKFKMNALRALHCISDGNPNPVVEVEQAKQVTPVGATGCSTVIQYREWAQEWRIRTQVDAGLSMPPPAGGDRISELLSNRGAKKIAESCEYMSLKRGGYKTFVTGTFNEEIRKKIQSGETTIQREVSRTMDALQKMYARGWVTPEGEKIEGQSDGLAYCWVVEIPVNERGEENPHIHMLLGWRVAYRHFSAWAERIERIWGNGYFKLEKIKDCKCAGAYMAKAAGYITKAQGDTGQGVVRGNRYGISECARAPDWVVIGKAQLHSMGQIIADVYDHLTVKYGAEYRERKALNKKLADTPKTAKFTRQKIGERLQAVRESLNKVPVRCNKYQIILKGQTVAGLFLTWAKGEHLNSLPDWLPELPKELAWQEGWRPGLQDGHWFKSMQRQFQKLKRRRHAITDEIGAALVEQWQAVRNCALSAWEAWAGGCSDLCQ